MADVVRKTGAFLQDVREILRKKNDDERAKCPRCRGSGLLYLQSPWHRSSPPSNAPCLFCEGLGVMSIVGLRGYMIGRTDAMLNTKEVIKNRPTVPENTQQVHSSCKLSTRRHFSLPPGSVSNPVWLQEARREASLIEEAVDHSTELRESIDEISPLGLVGLDQAGWRYRHKFYARTSDSFSSIPSAFDTLKGADSSVDLRGSNDADSSKGPSKHVRLSSRGPRSSRRPRNRIREKAEREAEARARRVHKPVQSSSFGAPSWNPLLRMCRFLMPLSTPDPPKKRLVIDAA